MAKVRVGIVGSKFAADFHCDAYSRNETVEIAAVAAIDNLDAISRKWKIPATYEDYNEMLKKEKLDLLSVCVPNFLHHDVVIAASNSGVHAVCEKPLAISAAQGKEMVRVCETNKTKLFYAEDWVNAPAMKRAVALVEEGGIGEVLYVKAKEAHNGTHSPFARDKKTCGGGCFIHLGIHPVSWLLYFLGKGDNPVVEITGKMSGGADQNFVHKENSGEDFAMAMMKFKKGQFAFVEGNYITKGGMDDKVEIYGTDGVLKIDLTFSSPVSCYSEKGISYSIEKADINNGWTRPAVDEFYNLGYVDELSYFVNCVRNDERPFYGVDGKSGAAALGIVEAFYQSCEQGKTVCGEWI